MADRKHYITPLADRLGGCERKQVFPEDWLADVIRTSEWSKPYSITDPEKELDG